MPRVSSKTRQELAAAVSERYRGSARAEKLRILDEFVAVTGYHRKHAVRLFNTLAVVPKGKARRVRLYDDGVREALVVMWEASDRVCGKRLKALMATLVPPLERHG